MCQVCLERPLTFLHPENLAHLQRYMVAGCFGAHAIWLSLRATNSQRVKHEIIMKSLKDFLRDDSWDYPQLQDLEKALENWVLAGRIEKVYRADDELLSLAVISKLGNKSQNGTTSGWSGTGPFMNTTTSSTSSC